MKAAEEGRVLGGVGGRGCPNGRAWWVSGVDQDGGFGRGGGGEGGETENPNKGGGTKAIAGAVWKAGESSKPLLAVFSGTWIQPFSRP